MLNFFKKSSNVCENLDSSAPLLEVRNLSLSFHQYRKGLKETTIHVIRNLDLQLHSGEIVAIVGASGSGKSLLANAILGLLPVNSLISGSIRFMGEPLTEDTLHHIRGDHISLVPQSIHALNPFLKTGKQVDCKPAAKTAILQRLQLPVETEKLYPFELSGGMARRVLVASAFASTAKLIIADEPTPGLDPFALGEMANYFKELAHEGRGIMFITHDIETALLIADRIAILYAGEIVEVANARSFTENGELLRHPYTKALWNALPQNGFIPLKGHHPSIEELLTGCSFQPRCAQATEECLHQHPPSKMIGKEMVRCFYA